jgi:hypothetical protein
MFAFAVVLRAADSGYRMIEQIRGVAHASTSSSVLAFASNLANQSKQAVNLNERLFDKEKPLAGKAFGHCSKKQPVTHWFFGLEKPV